MVGRLACFRDLASYTDQSGLTGYRVYARQKPALGPTDWGLDVVPITSPLKNTLDTETTTNDTPNMDPIMDLSKPTGSMTTSDENRREV